MHWEISLMNARYVFKRILMLIKEIRNPPLFLYLVHHYLKKSVPERFARKIAAYNISKYGENDVVFLTYDGSNQMVHPDCLIFQDNYWFVGTPYPYGMEEYENPCVYKGKELEDLWSNNSYPIDRQRRHEIGFHLSDPCLFVFQQELFCGYRENTRENNIEHNLIYVKKLLPNDQWSERKLVIESVSDSLLSPAFVCYDDNGVDELSMIHVNRTGDSSFLVESKLDSHLNIISQQSLKCEGIPDGYYVWHIAVSFKDGIRRDCKKQKLEGLFLLKNAFDGGDYKLYFAEKESNKNWIISHQVMASETIRSNELHPYKSCFIPSTKKIIYSYIDYKRRYRLEIVDINEVLA